MHVGKNVNKAHEISEHPKNCPETCAADVFLTNLYSLLCYETLSAMRFREIIFLYFDELFTDRDFATNLFDFSFIYHYD